MGYSPVLSDWLVEAVSSTPRKTLISDVQCVEERDGRTTRAYMQARHDVYSGLYDVRQEIFTRVASRLPYQDLLLRIGECLFPQHESRALGRMGWAEAAEVLLKFNAEGHARAKVDPAVTMRAPRFLLLSQFDRLPYLTGRKLISDVTEFERKYRRRRVFSDRRKVYVTYREIQNGPNRGLFERRTVMCYSFPVLGLFVFHHQRRAATNRLLSYDEAVEAIRAVNAGRRKNRALHHETTVRPARLWPWSSYERVPV